MFAIQWLDSIAGWKTCSERYDTEQSARDAIVGLDVGESPIMYRVVEYPRYTDGMYSSVYREMGSTIVH